MSTEKVPKYEHDNREKVLAEIGDEEVKAITDYWKNIDLKKYFEAADLILNSKQIFICGRGISWTMAEYMKNRLSSCEVLGITANTELNDDVYGMLTSLTEESLLIPISFPETSNTWIWCPSRNNSAFTKYFLFPASS